MDTEPSKNEQDAQAERQDASKQKSDVLENLNISEEAKKQLRGNAELLSAITHNITAKREANAEAKKNREALEILQVAKKKAEDQKLEKQGEYKQLYEDAQKAIVEKDTKLKSTIIQSKVSLLAQQKGIKKDSYLKMFDTAGLTVDDNLNITNLEDKFGAFVTDHPDLFGKTEQKEVQTDTGQPIISNPTLSLTEKLKDFEKRAALGNVADIAKLVTFKRKNKLGQFR